MSRVIVKLCGITEERDAQEAARLGVDVLGFHFSAESPSFVHPDDARRIVERLPIFVGRVGVFAGEPISRILDVARRVGLTAVELHGDEPVGAAEALGPLAWYRALAWRADLEPSRLAESSCSTFLLLAEGERVAWERVRHLSLYGRILVGGRIDPEGAEEVVRRARPYGVSVGREVDVLPGKKDLDRVERLVRAVRAAEGSLEP